MQWIGIIGNALIGWAPHFAIIFGYLRVHPQLIMVAVAACFWFIGAAHVCAMLWMIVSGLKDNAEVHSVFGVIITEGCRYAFFRTYMKCEKVFGRSFDEVIYLTEYSVVPAAVASGIGWASGQSLLGFGMLFSYHLDPTVTDADAILFSRSACNDLSTLTLQAIQSMLYSIATVGWTVTCFAAYYSLHFPDLESRKFPVHTMGTPLNKKVAWRLLLVTGVLHLTASFTGGFGLPCAASIPMLIVITIASCAGAIFITKLVHKPGPEEGGPNGEGQKDKENSDRQQQQQQQQQQPAALGTINEEEENAVELQNADLLQDDQEMVGEIIDPAIKDEEGIAE
eukprot:TRINITY_DN1926_c0_g1_i1.p1 TRINITY_DN1926_c0_g1~~TRINITY_DN1926_c0_g1_i1.p1  ORF type:complete len:364 (+),score=66.62 TRINITY_DN1926_c0_g1_i1:76-1092(+)